MKRDLNFTTKGTLCAQQDFCARIALSEIARVADYGSTEVALRGSHLAYLKELLESVGYACLLTVDPDKVPILQVNW